MQVRWDTVIFSPTDPWYPYFDTTIDPRRIDIQYAPWGWFERKYAESGEYELSPWGSAGRWSVLKAQDPTFNPRSEDLFDYWGKHMVVLSADPDPLVCSERVREARMAVLRNDSTYSAEMKKVWGNPHASNRQNAEIELTHAFSARLLADNEQWKLRIAANMVPAKRGTTISIGDVSGVTQQGAICAVHLQRLCVLLAAMTYCKGAGEMDWTGLSYHELEQRLGNMGVSDIVEPAAPDDPPDPAWKAFRAALNDTMVKRKAKPILGDESSEARAWIWKRGLLGGETVVVAADSIEAGHVQEALKSSADSKASAVLVVAGRLEQAAHARTMFPGMPEQMEPALCTISPRVFVGSAETGLEQLFKEMKEEPPPESSDFEFDQATAMGIVNPAVTFCFLATDHVKKLQGAPD